MIEEPSAKYFSAALVTRKQLVRLTSSTWCQSSSGISSTVER